ncbi:MAG TPA: hypothetical protein VFA47_09890 [Candidatus Manganitrophaceae bacterium]|nr:hypothetical protein [Candidatus Manganitrophaceae bacterium]
MSSYHSKELKEESAKGAPSEAKEKTSEPEGAPLSWHFIRGSEVKSGAALLREIRREVKRALG